MKRVLLSGGFDPLHIGHLHYIKDAMKRWLGYEIIVMVNDDKWLMEKKGRVLMNENDRREIVQAVMGSGRAEIAHYPISFYIRSYRPEFFAKGGDRTLETLPEDEIQACEMVGAEIVTDVGGGKIQSSSELLKAYAESP